MDEQIYIILSKQYSFSTLSVMHEWDNQQLYSMITECDGENISGHLKVRSKIYAVELIDQF